MSLLVVGTVAFDAIETPFGKTDKIVGGAASYIALAASHYTKNMHLVSVIGDDFPQSFVSDLQMRGVNTEGLQVKKGEKSFFWSGRYHNDLNSRDTLDTQLNVLADFNPVVPESAKHAEFLMLGNLMPSIQKRVLDQMKTRPKLVLLDTMNFWMDTAYDDLITNLKYIDVLTVNDSEARQLSGEYSLVKAARSIMQRGPHTVIIKKGEHGALLFNAKEVFFAPALPLEDVFDPTGAGDSFAGGFIGFLESQQRYDFNAMKQALIAGSALASFTVEAFGTQRLSTLSSDELETRIKAFSDLVHYKTL